MVLILVGGETLMEVRTLGLGWVIPLFRMMWLP
jgi:hypothetical protein